MRSVELNLSAAANPPDKRTAAGTDPRQNPLLSGLLWAAKKLPRMVGKSRDGGRRWSPGLNYSLAAGGGGIDTVKTTTSRAVEVINVLSAHAAPTLPPSAEFYYMRLRSSDPKAQSVAAQCPVPRSSAIDQRSFFLYDAAHTEQALSWNGTELELVCLAGSMYSIQSNRVRPDSSR